MNFKIIQLITIATIFSQGHILSLDDCINISIKNKISIKKNEFDLERSKQMLKESYGNILPSIYLNANTTYYLQENSYNSSELEFPSSYLNKYASLSLSQNIYDGGVWWNTIAKSKNSIEIIKQINRQNLINTILDVMVSYYRHLKSIQILEVSNSSLTSAEEQLKLIEKKFELGSAKKTDLLKAEVRWGQIRVQVINNNVSLENAYRNLKNAMGIINKEMNFEIIDSNLFVSKLPEYDQSLKFLKINNPSILAKEYQLIDAQYFEKISKGARYPRINATANYLGDLNQINILDKYWQQNIQLNTGFSITLPIFSGNTISSRIKQAKLNVLKKESEYFERIQDLSVRLQIIIDRLNNYNEILSINNTILMSAMEDVKLIQEKYTLGSASILELLDAQVSELSARSSIISARYDALIEHANFNALLGKLDSDYK